jgi:uncharacterized protein (UPF0261 family)
VAVRLDGDQPFWLPEADAALFDALERHAEQTPQRRVERVAAHINDAAFVAAVVRALRELNPAAARPTAGAP